MAVLALTFAVVAFQSVESKIEKQLAPFTYKTLPPVKTAEGLRLTFLREVPVYEGGIQAAGGQGGIAHGTPPKVKETLRDEAIFILADKKVKMEWPASKNHSTTREAFLGKLDGYEVYAQGPIGELTYVAKGLPFKGGADWRELGIIGLTAQGPGYRGVTNEYFFTRTGDSSLPLLMRAIEKKPKYTWGLIRAIGETSGPGSIPALQKLYKSNDKEVVRAVAYTLISSPRKNDARVTLLDMLEKGLYVQYVAPIAAQNSWLEALPILKKVKVEPGRFLDLVAVMEAERILKPSGIDNLRQAFADLRQGKDDKGENTKFLLEQPDKELAAAYAMALQGIAAKGNTTQQQETGKFILGMLPKEAVDAVKARFKSQR